MSRPISKDSSVGAEKRQTLSVQPGRVENVCRQWIVHEDAVLATRLQESEFERKYNRNCEERQLARQDVPLARQFQNTDEEYARNMRQRQLQRNQDVIGNDALLAEKLQSEEIIKTEQERIHLELKDEEIARRLQEKEKKRYELRVKEKELRKQRKMLENELKHESRVLLDTHLTEGVADLSASGVENRLRSERKPEGRSDPNNFFSQTSDPLPQSERRQLQHLQDEDLARVLQDEELQRGSHSNRDRLRQIELRDAELAKIMQDQEVLKRQRRRHHRHREARQSSDPCHSNNPILSAETRHSNSLPQTLEEGHVEAVVTSSGLSYRSRPSQHLARTDEFDVENDFVRPSRSADSVTKFASRPLPDTPSPDVPLSSQATRGCNMSLMRALDRNMEEQTRGVTTSDVQRYPSGRDARRAPLVLSDEEEEDWLVSPEVPPPPAPSLNVPASSASSNIFAAIDPTWGQGREQPSEFSPGNSASKHSPAGAVTSEDGYCDLDDVRAFRMLQNQDDEGELDVVPGQRRQPLYRDNRRSSGRKSNCKQQ